MSLIWDQGRRVCVTRYPLDFACTLGRGCHLAALLRRTRASAAPSPGSRGGCGLRAAAMPEFSLRSESYESRQIPEFPRSKPNISKKFPLFSSENPTETDRLPNLFSKFPWTEPSKLKNRKALPRTELRPFSDPSRTRFSAAPSFRDEN
jgi:hypothetical protein